MKDSVILGTGNSRYIKSAISETATWEEFRAMLRAGTFPFDFNGINKAGFAQVGDVLNKNNLLKDATAALFGLGSTALPDDIFRALKALVDDNTNGVSLFRTKGARVEVGSYTGTNADTKSLTFGFVPKLVVIYGGTSANKTIHAGSCAIVPCYGLTASMQNYGYLLMGVYGFQSTSNNYASLSGNTIAVGYNDGLNTSGVTYRYIAIG